MNAINENRIEFLGNISRADVPIYSIIFLSSIFHGLSYYILPASLIPLKKSYIVSTFHAIICVASVINFYLNYSVNLKQINRIAGGGIYGTGDETMIYAICYSCGYFLYDFLLMLFNKSVRTTSAVIHHIVMLIGMYSGIRNGIGHPCHFYLLIEELSTIPLNLKAIYHDHPHLYNIFTSLFVVFFLLSRLVYGTIICAFAFSCAPEFIRLALKYNDMRSVFIGIFQIVLCIMTRALNFYWAYLIFKKLLRLKQKKSD